MSAKINHSGTLKCDSLQLISHHKKGHEVLNYTTGVYKCSKADEIKNVSDCKLMLLIIKEDIRSVCVCLCPYIVHCGTAEKGAGAGSLGLW